jgi:cell cycle arrest protein BUB3
MAEVVLNSPPTDGISSVRFDDSRNLLVAASWDSTVRVYDTDANALKSSWKHKAPVLDATFLSADVVVSAGLDREVKL